MPILSELPFCFCLGVVLASATLIGQAVELPDLEDGYGAAAGWDGRVFRLSKAYPVDAPSETQPWKGIGTIRPAEYLTSLLDYCFEGNLDTQSDDPSHFEIQFDVEQNGIRKWYHAPWLHVGRHPREFIHGLTDERRSETGELAGTQSAPVNNFAVSFYNPVGATTFHQVWLGSEDPAIVQPRFREGTVTFKLLFTEATDTQVPWLAGAPVWRADVPRKSHPANLESAKALRLLQVDVAVRDETSKCGGWVFGTFHYDSSISNPNPWRRLRPFALTWGNDEGLTQSQFDSGQAIPHESWINRDSPLFKYRMSGHAPTQVFGWAGRANGPVDNPVSSCLSCHSTGQRPPFPNLIPPRSATEDERLRWFRNLAVGQPFESGKTSMDFSLQMASGVQNYTVAHPRRLIDRLFRAFHTPEPVDISRSGESH